MLILPILFSWIQIRDLLNRFRWHLRSCKVASGRKINTSTRTNYRRLAHEALELRLAMIVEGSTFAIDTVLDTSALLGSITAQADWGDGTRTPIAVSPAPAVGPLRVRFDYSLDISQFFNTAEKRDILQVAADIVLSRFSDSLAAITPSGTNIWQAVLFNPSGLGQISIPNLTIAANELVVYVGARPIGGQTVALGGSGGSSSSGTTPWVQAVTGRGQAGALSAIPTDTSPWGGSITVDPNVKWHFGPTTEGLDPDEYDFLTAVSHEFMHVLGFGITFKPFGNTSSWDRYVSGGNFFGPASVATNGGAAVPLDGDLLHWREGTQSAGQETLMDPSINSRGIRKLPTPLDFAGLSDLGWSVITQQVRVTGSKAYGDDGNFPVEVILTGSRAGAKSTPLGTVSVTNVAPTLNPRGNSIGQANVPVSIVDLGVFQDQGFGTTETFRYEINWGDGTAPDTGAATVDQIGSAGVATLGSFDGLHTFAQAGNYTVRFRVSDDNGGLADQSFSIQINPPPELKLSISQTEIKENAGDNAATLLIESFGLDNSQSITLQLVSSDPSEATLPTSITIPAGATSVSVAISAVDDTLLDGTQRVQFTAQLGSLVSLPASIQVLDHETVSLALNVTQVREDGGPGAAVLRVTRSNTDNTSPLDVQLSSSNLSIATIPTLVTIPANAASLDVSVTVIDDSIRDGNQNVSFDAAAINYVGSSATLNVLDYEPLQWVEQGIAFAESSTSQAQSITIRLPAPAPDAGVTLNFVADMENQLQFPSQVFVAGGQFAATVSVSAINDTFAESLKTVKLIASGPGFDSASISISLTDDDRSIWTNSENVFDVNGDGSVDPIDVLQIINFIKRSGTSTLPATRNPLGPPFIDVNGNGSIEPVDVLLVINFLTRRARQQ